MHLMDRLLCEGKGLDLEETFFCRGVRTFRFVPELVLTLLLFPSPDAVLHARPVHVFPAGLQPSARTGSLHEETSHRGEGTGGLVDSACLINLVNPLPDIRTRCSAPCL